MMNFLLITSIGVLLSGCAPYEIPPLSANHPANPLAIPAPKPPRSQTLAYTRADLPSSKPIGDTAATQPGGHEAHHSGASAAKTVNGEGKVIATVPENSQLVIDHGAIEGFMGAMTMGYPVEPPSQLEGLKPGDHVRFTIDVAKKTIVKLEKK